MSNLTIHSVHCNLLEGGYYVSFYRGPRKRRKSFTPGQASLNRIIETISKLSLAGDYWVQPSLTGWSAFNREGDKE